jgi:hypothetical protein
MWVLITRPRDCVAYHVLDGLPQFDDNGVVGDLDLDIFGNRRIQVVEDRLILTEPIIVVQVWQEINRLGLVQRDLLWWHGSRCGVEEVPEPHTVYGGENMATPHIEVVLPEFL